MTERGERNDSTGRINFVIYDPENPLYEVQHLCVYLGELRDLADEDTARTAEGGEKIQEGEKK